MHTSNTLTHVLPIALAFTASIHHEINGTHLCTFLLQPVTVKRMRVVCRLQSRPHLLAGVESKWRSSQSQRRLQSRPHLLAGVQSKWRSSQSQRRLQSRPHLLAGVQSKWRSSQSQLRHIKWGVYICVVNPVLFCIWNNSGLIIYLHQYFQYVSNKLNVNKDCKFINEFLFWLQLHVLL